MNADIEQIVELDHLNMAAILEQVGVHFEPARRRKGLLEEINKGAVFIMVKREGRIIAYLEYLPECDGSIHIKSIQVHPNYQRRLVLRQLLAEAHSNFNDIHPALVKTSVHRSNRASLALHRKLGFQQVEQTGERTWFEVDGAQLLNRLAAYAR